MRTRPRSTEKDWRPARMILPLLLIVAGIIFLLNNFGILPWSVWSTLATLWPVILILFGLDIAIGRRGGALTGVLTVFVLAAVIVGAMVLGYATVPARSTTAQPVKASQENLPPTPAARAQPAMAARSGMAPAPISASPGGKSMVIPLGEAKSGNVTLDFPAGTLNVGALPSKGDNLIEGTASLPPGMNLTVQSLLHDGVRQVTLGTDGQQHWRAWFLQDGWPFGSDGPPKLAWNVKLVPTTPLTFQANVGAGKSDFELTNLMIQHLSVESGAGETTISFPAQAGQTTAEVKAGAGHLILIIPPGVGAHIHTSHGGLAHLTVPSNRFHAVSDGYETADYASAKNRLDLSVDLGVGSVDVR